MTTIKKTLLLTLSLCVVASSAFADAFPPQPGKNYVITLNNATANPVSWHYHETFGSCDAKPSNDGSLSSYQAGFRSGVDCAFTASGQYDFVDTNTHQAICSVAAGYGGVNVLSGHCVANNAGNNSSITIE